MPCVTAANGLLFAPDSHMTIGITRVEVKVKADVDPAGGRCRCGHACPDLCCIVPCCKNTTIANAMAAKRRFLSTSMFPGRSEVAYEVQGMSWFSVFHESRSEGGATILRKSQVAASIGMAKLETSSLVHCRLSRGIRLWVRWSAVCRKSHLTLICMYGHCNAIQAHKKPTYSPAVFHLQHRSPSPSPVQPFTHTSKPLVHTDRSPSHKHH